MAFELLGRLVWFGAKWYLRRRMGAGRRMGGGPKKVTAGLVVAGAVGALVLAGRRQIGN
jgi:hypothetical protein